MNLANVTIKRILIEIKFKKKLDFLGFLLRDIFLNTF
tara:strand:+ start:472 stop:582 length:111 start_codon:yes stop_codon:yes gene_type:complete